MSGANPNQVRILLLPPNFEIGAEIHRAVSRRLPFSIQKQLAQTRITGKDVSFCPVRTAEKRLQSKNEVIFSHKSKLKITCCERSSVSMLEGINFLAKYVERMRLRIWVA